MSQIDSSDALRDIVECSMIEVAKDVIATEVAALEEMSARLADTDDFQRSVDMIISAGSRVAVIGMGKSGIIGRKIVATLASTGTPAFFVHPGEAFHGDLGMILPEDIVLIISNSGETEELIRLMPFMRANKIIAMTGCLSSTLARGAHAVLDVSVPREACHNNLAPTSSTTATLVMGDALSVALGTVRGFQPHDFARFHPGGSLGRRLLTRVQDAMRTQNLPFCSMNDLFRDVVHTMTVGRLGLAIVIEDGQLAGVISDGDIRRAFEHEADPLKLIAKELMTRKPQTIAQECLFSEAENKMRSLKINSLVVVSAENSMQVAGVIQIWA